MKNKPGWFKALVVTLHSVALLFLLCIMAFCVLSFVFALISDGVEFKYDFFFYLDIGKVLAFFVILVNAFLCAAARFYSKALFFVHFAFEQILILLMCTTMLY